MRRIFFLAFLGGEYPKWIKGQAGGERPINHIGPQKLLWTQSVPHQEWLGPKVFTCQIAYYERKIWQEIIFKFSRNYLEHVFNVTLSDLKHALWIDSMQLRRGFVQFFSRFFGGSLNQMGPKADFECLVKPIKQNKGYCDGLESGLR